MNPSPTIVLRAEWTAPSDSTEDHESQHPARRDTETEQFRQAQAGSPEAFAALIDAYGPRILRYLQRWTGNTHDAEDLTQETFLKAYRNLGQCAHARAVSGWLFTIARRTALNFHRARRCRPSNWVELQPDTPEPPRAPVGADAEDCIWETARGLAPEHYEVLWLCYAEGLSAAEIARVLGRTVINVRVQLHRARRQLRQRMETQRKRSIDHAGPSENPKSLVL